MRVKNVAVVLLLLFAVACASREAILSRTFAGLNAAHVAFVDFDKSKQENDVIAEAKMQADIIASANSIDEGKASLEAWRSKRDMAVVDYRAKQNKVAAGFVAAYTAVAVTSFDLTDATLLYAVNLASAVIEALKDLGVLSGGAR